jgi:30S ribosomal protein S31
MGRGDKKTKKGKIFKGSFGKSRLARPAKPVQEKKKGLLEKILG